MKSQFEEKSYENYFNVELSNKSSFFYPPGQVQEGFLGFDSAANSKSWNLWKSIGFPFWFFPHFKGANLRMIADEMENILNIEIENVPLMKANILFQYKRSEYIKTSKGKEWSHWSRPYYRYDIYLRQQELLMKIYAKFQHEILILYAAPAIHEMSELVNSFHDKQIINKSNFKKVQNLNNHYRNTFIQSGLNSVACSEPERINNFDLISFLSDYQNVNNSENNKEFIIDFSRKIREVLIEDKVYNEMFETLNKPYEKIKMNKLLYNFIILSNFKLLTGIQWLIKI